MATRQAEPAHGCKASKEELSSDGFKYSDDCPMCEKLEVLCFVANHPSRPLPPTGKKLILLLFSSYFLCYRKHFNCSSSLSLSIA